MERIDINCDLGEEPRHGTELTPNESELLNLVTSVNIACGYHAGDHNSMAVVAKAAVERGVAIGAHPGLPDKDGFGRREMSLAEEDVYNLVAYQVGAMAAIARTHGTQLSHVKVHGSLYHMAEVDPATAYAIVAAIAGTFANAFVVGLSGGYLVAEAEQLGLRAQHEVFADRAYRPDGTLQPRDLPNALITDPHVAAARIVGPIRSGSIEAIDGSFLALRADTVCIHGDNPRAPEFARVLREALDEAGVEVARRDGG